MELIKKRGLSDLEMVELLELWNAEYPKTLAHSSIDSLNDYLTSLAETKHLLLLDERQKVRGWCFCFNRENQPWFAIIIDSKLKGQGFGTQLLNALKKEAQMLNGWVIDHNTYEKLNLEPYQSPLPFYLKNGFQILSEERLELEHISAVKIKWQKT